MTPTENLHYAIGELAYAIASADGEVQQEEKKRFHDIIVELFRGNEHSMDVSEIIFKIMEREKTPTKDAYNWAVKQIKLNSHYLSPDLKETFIKVVQKVAEAYPPVTKEEKELIDRFNQDIHDLKGDPIYYVK
jgi:uncharacterized tellurite resistance protein B-like protein